VDSNATFQEHFDGVVMLAWSQHRPQLHGNGDHYAARFAKLCPTLLVQADQSTRTYHFESTAVAGVVVLHIWSKSCPERDRILADAIREHGIHRPLLWIRDTAFESFIRAFACPLKVYHASKDYFVDQDSRVEAPLHLATVLRFVDLLVAVSDGIRDSFLTRGQYRGSSHVASMGGDADSKTPADTETGRAEQIDGTGFSSLIDHIARIADFAKPGEPAHVQLRILVMYCDHATFTATTREHLEAFKAYSKHEVWYAVATRDAAVMTRLDFFDVVILHYSVRLSLESYIAAPVASALKQFTGCKVLFIQDEYETTETARRWIEQLAIDVLFTCVPKNQREEVYPTSRFPDIEFHQNLTGYSPDRFEQRGSIKPIANRSCVIGYRGRQLPYWYGELGRDKYRIGVEMRRVCNERGIPVDIEWDDTKRIYGTSWYDWLQDCRATLGTESGSNVFDYDGTIRAEIEKAMRTNPRLEYEEVWNRWVAPHEGKVRMNQISPRVFEAIAMNTALILYEGEYSGIIEPDVHYIPLKKDFSNVDDVLDKVRDDDFVKPLVDRAFTDVIASRDWNYSSFIARVDRILENRATPGDRPPSVSALVGARGAFGDRVQVELQHRQTVLGNMVLDAVLAPNDLQVSTSIDYLTPYPSTRVSAADVLASLKAFVGQRLQHRPRVHKSAVWCYQLPFRFYRGMLAAGSGIGRVFRRNAS